MNKKWLTAIAIYIGLLVMCFIALYAVPSVRGMLEKTYIAEYGKIDVKDEVSAFIVRDETVYVAAQASYINRIAETDKLVKAKTRVVELTPNEDAIAKDKAKDEARAEAKQKEKAKAEAEEKAEADTAADSQETSDKDKKSDDSDDAAKDKDKKDDDKSEGAEEAEDEESGKDYTGKYDDIMAELGDSAVSTELGYNKTAGYVSYYVDGAEAKLSTNSLDEITYKDFKKYSNRRAIECPAKKCGRGYPVYKIVKNSKWYLVFYVSEKDAARYEPGETVTVELNGEPVDVTVAEVIGGSKNTRIALSCKSFFDGFLETRSLDTTITLASAEGLVLIDSSIVEASDGKRGVFVKNKLGEHVFKPIRAKADDGTKCVVYSDIYVDADGNYVETIKTYDEIIQSPTEEDLKSIGAKTKKEEDSENAEETE